jgi:hypothetical protein
MKQILSTTSTAAKCQQAARGALGLITLTIALTMSSCQMPSNPRGALSVYQAPATAEVVPGKIGFVFSPFVPGNKMVNVTKFSAGTQARCPYTDKIFVVPNFAVQIKSPAALAYAEVPFSNFALSNYSTKVPLRPQPLQPTDPVAIIKRLGLDVFSIDVSHPVSNVGPLGVLPFAKNVPGTPGMVYSPFGGRNQLVDVAGLVPGVEATCPYTGKLFRVPAPTMTVGMR